MKKITLILTACLLISCSSFNIEPTPTPLPTSTPSPTITPSPTLTPTPTKNPCSDIGWSDISIYLKQFNRVMGDAQVGDSIAAILEQMENIKNQIADVKVDACTEYARQTLLKGLNNQISSFYAMLVEKDYEKWWELFQQGVLEIKDALDELKELGIDY